MGTKMFVFKIRIRICFTLWCHENVQCLGMIFSTTIAFKRQLMHCIEITGWEFD